MKKQILTIDIDKLGNITIDVEGFEGKKCLDITKSIEEKLGDDINRTMKKEIKNNGFISRKSKENIYTR